VVIPQSNGWVGVVVGVATWLVFLTDYVVHAVCIEHYWRTGFGWFDLFIVIATAPWFLIPFLQPGQFVVVLRLARLARLVMATKGARRLLERLGVVALVAGGVVVIGSLVAYHAEHASNPEFATVGDALWWGIVTLTTVGYGDIVPKTGTGRWAGVVIMVTGIATLGLLAGSLASFFRPDEDGARAGSPTTDETAGSLDDSRDSAVEALTTEVSALRRQIEILSARVAGALGDQTSEPAASDKSGPSEQA
jgi:voltage-gated potassium channel